MSAGRAGPPRLPPCAAGTPAAGGKRPTRPAAPAAGQRPKAATGTR